MVNIRKSEDGIVIASYPEAKFIFMWENGAVSIYTEEYIGIVLAYVQPNSKCIVEKC